MRLQNINFDEYVDIDKQVVTSEIRSDEDIVKDVLNKNTNENDQSDDDEAEETQAIKHLSGSEASLALEKLNQFFETNIVDDEFFYHYCKLKCLIDNFRAKEKLTMKQKTIFGCLNK